MEAFVLRAMAGVPSHRFPDHGLWARHCAAAGFSEKLGPFLGLPVGSREAR